MKIQISEIDRITGLSKWESTLENLIEGGWEITDEDIYALNEGASVRLLSPNGRRSLTITKINN